MQWTTFLECDFTTVLLSVAAIATLIYFLNSRRPKNFPPGPKGIPIAGFVPFLGKNGAETLRKLKPKYGPVMSFQMGMEDWVVLNDYETINEALVKQGEIFSGRPRNFMSDLVTKGNGVAMTDYGPVWKTLRKFGLMTLRGFGVGKKGMEENVEEEMPYLIESLLKEEKPNLQMTLNMSVSNIICRIVFGSRFAYDDERFIDLIRIIREVFGSGAEAKMLGLIGLIPALRFIPPFRGAFKRLSDDTDKMLGIIRDIMLEHKDTFQEDDLRDFIDAFLKEIEKKGDGDPSFNDGQLLQYIRDLFDGGTGTTSCTLTWAMFSFVHYPEIQEKLAKEVLHVLGEDGIPTMKHREDMPYTCAFIQELMRHRTLAPLSVFHKTNADAFLGGYTIPKNTTVSPNLWAVHMDPDIFDNPTEFRPERFLDENGKFIKSNRVIPFSIGPRHCLGEQLGIMEVFIFLAGIVQRLKVSPDPSKPLPPFEEGHFDKRLSLEPPEFSVRFEKR